jgi:hypothetical protein
MTIPNLYKKFYILHCQWCNKSFISLNEKTTRTNVLVHEMTCINKFRKLKKHEIKNLE